jgi:hypothetical protein
MDALWHGPNLLGFQDHVPKPKPFKDFHVSGKRQRTKEREFFPNDFEKYIGNGEDRRKWLVLYST